MKHVIIGDGIAGISTAETIRKIRPDDEIVILSNEPGPTYFRASLSKYINGIIPYRKMFLKPEGWYETNRIKKLVTHISGIKGKEKLIVSNENGDAVTEFDRLCIATGADPIMLDIKGSDLPEVMTFRSMHHSALLKEAFKKLKHIVVIGGGVLGMEIVESAVDSLVNCTVIQRGDLLGTPLFDESGADILFKRVTGEDGVHPPLVNVLFNEEVDEFSEENGHLKSVKTKSGLEIICDLVVVCIGITTNPSLFEESSLTFNRGLIVDKHQSTNIDGIYGAGDCVVYPTESGDMKPTRTWVTSRIQGKTAGFNMCGIPRLLFDEGPMYNASYMFDLMYSVIGEFYSSGVGYKSFSHKHDKFSYRKIIFKDDLIVGATMIGDRNGDQAIRRLIAQKVVITSDQDKQKLLDPAFDQNDFATKGIEYIMY